VTTVALVLDVVVGLLVVHSLVNAVLLRRPPRGAIVDERVSMLLPVRNEAHRVTSTLQSLLEQDGLAQAEIIVYDDSSTDATGDIIRAVGGSHVRLMTGGELPPGWLGKTHACARLAEAASGSVLVFVDADVVLSADAIAGTVCVMRRNGLQFVSPYPRQLTGSWLERLVQPLLWWSWLTFLPLRVAERSSRPSLAAANGQLLAVDAAAYRDAGGHAAVRADVVEDVALARALVSVGAHGGFVDGSAIARCRMYAGADAVVDGYAKSLWRAFGSPAGGIAVSTLLVGVGVLPWALLGVTAWAWPAAVGGPLSRLIAALRSGSRPLADAVAQPLSVLAFVLLVLLSIHRRHNGALAWKARRLP
jgi:hypothetical protein